MYEKLLKGDFSGFAGEYISLNGVVSTLLASGVTDDEDSLDIKAELPVKQSDGTYQWGVGESNGSGYVRVLYPIGVPVKFNGSKGVDDSGRKFTDDTSKIRLYTGQEDPGYDSWAIYFKK